MAVTQTCILITVDMMVIKMQMGNNIRTTTMLACTAKLQYESELG